jgi:hypothetical protein
MKDRVEIIETSKKSLLAKKRLYDRRRETK